MTKTQKPQDEKINWRDSTAFILVHLAALLVFWVGFSWVALAALVITYGLRMFAITAGYHRYFSHRTFKTSRVFQFILGLIGASSAQKGPLWWASHHRHHHRYSDTEFDIHSPRQKGFWWAHLGWILCDKHKHPDRKLVPDLIKFPELKFLDKYHLLAPAALAVTIFALGATLNFFFPGLKTSGLQLLIWGFFLSTVLLYHGTFLVNSLTHVMGRRRFQTDDDSRNSLIISLITLGEGWHNNHHRFPSSERQGFYWWEIDISHYVLRFLGWFKIVWDLRKPPAKVYATSRVLKWPNRELLDSEFKSR
ncbi:MAG: acyl-CoA desaturase [Calditrichaeota bacterium]|nr:MAG: acyl-CoA desaturase [Calditrichota bacterium]